jgi:hypothetical protein
MSSNLLNKAKPLSPSSMRLHCMLLVCVADCCQAMTSTRKGNKKLAIYDLKITMKWEAQAEDDADQVRSQAAGANQRSQQNQQSRREE